MYLLIVIWQQLLSILGDESPLSLGNVDGWKRQALPAWQVVSARSMAGGRHDDRVGCGWMRIHPLLVGVRAVSSQSLGVDAREMRLRGRRCGAIWLDG